MPRGSGRNEVSTATRMNYAGQQIDNRKFRGQSKAVNQFANTESVTCEKLVFFLFWKLKDINIHFSQMRNALFL